MLAAGLVNLNNRSEKSVWDYRSEPPDICVPDATLPGAQNANLTKPARLMRENKPNANGTKGTIIFTNASAALKGYPSSGAFAMACHAKSGLAQSMARELMPQGIHVANVPIDAAIGWTQEDGTRAHRLAGTTVDDNMADPDHIAETYLQLHHQHRSTWAFEVVLRPWSRSGDRHLNFSPEDDAFRQEVHVFIRDRSSLEKLYTARNRH